MIGYVRFTLPVVALMIMARVASAEPDPFDTALTNVQDKVEGYLATGLTVVSALVIAGLAIYYLPKIVKKVRGGI